MKSTSSTVLLNERSEGTGFFNCRCLYRYTFLTVSFIGDVNCTAGLSEFSVGTEEPAAACQS